MGKLADIIDNRLVGKLNNEIVVGIDIGSRGGKAVLLGDGQYFTAIKVDGYDFQQMLGNWYFGRSGSLRVIAGETP